MILNEKNDLESQKNRKLITWKDMAMPEYQSLAVIDEAPVNVKWSPISLIIYLIY